MKNMEIPLSLLPPPTLLSNDFGDSWQEDSMSGFSVFTTNSFVSLSGKIFYGMADQLLAV